MARGARAALPVSLPQGSWPEQYALATGLYLERFDGEALLLVADRHRLLTVNAAAADLFALAAQSFGSRPFSLQQGCDWLAGEYALDVQACRAKARELLAFGLKHGLLHRIGRGR
jgi:hypothetical protein